jgi:hypothetical protein
MEKAKGENSYIHQSPDNKSHCITLSQFAVWGVSSERVMKSLLYKYMISLCYRRTPIWHVNIWYPKANKAKNKITITILNSLNFSQQYLYNVYSENEHSTIVKMPLVLKILWSFNIYIIINVLWRKSLNSEFNEI